MSYTVKETRSFLRPAADLLAIAGALVGELGGKRPRKPPGDGAVHAEFNKAVGREVFGNRVQLIVRAADDGAGRGALSLEAYPVDPLGRPLAFGVVGDPARRVADAFWAGLTTRLEPTAT